MENIANNNVFSDKFASCAMSTDLREIPMEHNSQIRNPSAKSRLTTLSFHTELSASDLNRLLKIVSASNLP